MSLSMVLGTPTTASPSSPSLGRGAERAVAADHDNDIDSIVGQHGLQRYESVAMLIGIGTRRPEDRAASGENPPHVISAQWVDPPIHQALPAVLDPGDTGSLLPQPGPPRP